MVETLEGRRLLSAVVDAVWNGQAIRVVEGEYVVALRPGARAEDVVGGFASYQRIGGSDFYTVKSKKSIAQMEAWTESRPATVVAFTPNILLQKAAADQALPNDPFVGLQWHHNNTGQDVPDPLFDPSGFIRFSTGGGPGVVDADIDTAEAWTIVRGDPNAGDPSRQIVVGVIDTGTDWSHPDLAPNLWTNPNEIGGNGIDDDGNGYIDDVRGWDFVDEDHDVRDEDGHGTHVAGIIAAAGNNSVGVSGVIQQVKIMTLRVGGQFGFSIVDTINAMEYATQMKNRGINLVAVNGSFGGLMFPFNRVFNDAVGRMGQAGTLFVAAAGNEGSDIDPLPDFPARFSLNQPNVVTVAATNNRDEVAFFSNIGVASVHIAAPGVNILSTTPTYDVGALLETGQIVTSGTPNYGYNSGTSMAAPLVTGALALMKAAKPDAGMMELKQALLTGADKIPALQKPLPAGDPLVSTAGRLNVNRAILNLLNAKAGKDTSTRGDWAGVYGKQGQVIYGETGGAETFTNSFVTAQVSGASLQVFGERSNDPDALQQAFNRQNRIAAQLRSSGSIVLDLEFRGNESHRVSLYQADLGNRDAGAQTIALVDPDSGETFASYDTGNLSRGEYTSFEVNPASTPASDGIYRLRLVITGKDGGAAVLSGLFFDRATTNDAALVTAAPFGGVTEVTGGDWRRQHGSQGAWLAGGPSSFPVPVTVTKGQRVTLGQFAGSAAALIKPGATNDGQRVAGYVRGTKTAEVRVDLSRYGAGAQRRLTVYAADLENAGRAQRLELYDDATGALLSSVDMTDFERGEYVSWVVSGRVRVRAVRMAGPSAVIGGVFLDAAPADSAVQYQGMDVVSSGNWKTYYGTDAQFIFGSKQAPARKNVYSSDLAYGWVVSPGGAKNERVTLRVTGGGSATHQSQTNDPRYPLLPSETQTLRTAAAKQTGNSMNLDLKFTDQRARRVAVYMVDPDANDARAQRVEIQVFDRASGQFRTVASQTVTNFSKGKYVVFHARQTQESAPADVRVKVTRVAGPSAVVNAVFIG